MNTEMLKIIFNVLSLFKDAYLIYFNHENTAYK